MEIHSLILIGASTGGPGRIHEIVDALPSSYSGTIIIAQHMAEPIISSFVKQLNVGSQLPVYEAKTSIQLEHGHVYVCATTSHLYTEGSKIILEPFVNHQLPYNPNIDHLFLSASLLEKTIRKMGVVLTGIGEDGARGSLALYDCGGDCYFENEESATVFGMPRRAKELVPDAMTGTMKQIIDAIKQFGNS